MASRTFPTGSDRITVGSGSTLDNLATGTVLAWVRTSTGTPTATIWSKGPTAVLLRFTGTWSRVGLDIFHTPSPHTSAETTALPAGGDNKWLFVAASWNTAGALTDQHIYGGDLTTIADEASSYSFRTIGSVGGQRDDSASDGIWGGREGGTNPLTVPLQVGAVFNRQLSLGEIRSWQFQPRALAGCVNLVWPGWDDGTTIPDLSGNKNNGTLVGSPSLANGAPLPLSWASPPASDYIPPTITTSGRLSTRRRRGLVAILASQRG